MLELALRQGSGDGVVSCLLPLKLVWAYQHRWYLYWLGCRYHLQSDQESISSNTLTLSHSRGITRDLFVCE